MAVVVARGGGDVMVGVNGFRVGASSCVPVVLVCILTHIYLVCAVWFVHTRVRKKGDITPKVIAEQQLDRA